MQENYTDAMRKLLVLARDAAVELRHDYVGTEHMLLGLLALEDSNGMKVLRGLDADTDLIGSRIVESVRRGREYVAPGQLPYTSRSKKSLELASVEARTLGDNFVDTEHILLGMIAEQKCIAAVVLSTVGVNLEDARSEVLRMRKDTDQ